MLFKHSKCLSKHSKQFTKYVDPGRHPNPRLKIQYKRLQGDCNKKQFICHITEDR
mgnify:CR=1 FL=1